MHPVSDILHRLDGHWDRIVRRPFTPEELEKLEEAIGIPMPHALRDLVLGIGLFQDLLPADFGGRELQFFEHPRDFVDGRRAVFGMLEDDEGLVPFADDGAGNYFALRSSDPSGDMVYLVDHEKLATERLSLGFVAWLEGVVDRILSGEERTPNAQKSWRVEFSFSRAPSLELILSLLMKVGRVHGIGEWQSDPRTPGGVVGSSLTFLFDNQPLVIRKMEHPMWEFALFFLDMSEPVDQAMSDSLILRLDAIFEESDLGYQLVDYGPVEVR